MLPIEKQQLEPLVRNDLNGLIVTMPKSAKIYLIDLGKKRLINRETFLALFEDNTRIFEDLDIHFIKDGKNIPDESFMFRCEDSPKIFFVDGIPPNQVKRHIVSPAVMGRYGFDWRAVHLFNVPLQAIGYPDGTPITNPPNI